MDSRIYYLITKTESAMSNYIRQRFQSAGLKVTPAQVGILFLLKGGADPTMTELSRDLGADNSAVTRAVDRLEKAGLVERKNGTDDRREYRITITGAGIDETEGAKRIIAEINSRIAGEFRQNELDEFRKTLTRMNELFRT